MLLKRKILEELKNLDYPPVLRGIIMSYKAGFFLLLLPCLLFAEAIDLEKDSMLYQSKLGEKNRKWNFYHPANPKKALEKAAVFLAVSPRSLLTQPHQSPLFFLGRADLWEIIQDL